MNKVGFILLCTVLLTACHNTINNVDCIAIDINQYLNVKYKEDIVEECKYLPLQMTDDNFLIQSINKIFFIDSLLFVIDRSQDVIFAFDLEGKPLYQIGHKGQGPGEYITLADVTLDRKEHAIIIDDVSSRKIISYDLQGNLLYEKRLPDVGMHYFAKDQKANLFVGERVDIDKDILILFDTDKSIIHSTLKIDKSNRNAYKPYQSIYSDSRFYEFNDTIFYISIFDYSIYSYSEGKFNKEYCLSIPDKCKIIEIKQANITDPYEMLDEYANRHWIYDITSFVVSHDYIAFKIWGGDFLHYNILYNRQTKTSYFYEDLYSQKTKKIHQPPITTVYGDWYVFPIEFNSGLEYLKNNVGLKLQEDDNPVLCFVKFKK